MGWTAYINVYATHGADLEKAREASIAECDRFLILPGSEPLAVGFDGLVQRSTNYPGYEHIGFGFCKIQSSLNPMLSLTSAMYVAKGIASRLSSDFVIEFSHDYGDQRDARTFTRIELILSELQAMLMWPVFILMNLPRTIGFLIGTTLRPFFMVFVGLKRKALNDLLKSLSFTSLKIMPEELTDPAIELHAALYNTKNNPVPQPKISIINLYSRRFFDADQYLYRIAAEIMGHKINLPYWHILTCDPLLNAAPAFKLVSRSNPEMPVAKISYGAFQYYETTLAEFNNRFALYLPNADVLSFFSTALLSKINAFPTLSGYSLVLMHSQDCLVCYLQVDVVNPFRPLVGYDSKAAINELVSVATHISSSLLDTVA